MRGDIDGDGKITENDRNRISKHLGGTITLTGTDSWCAKVTGNNEISVSDLVQLVQYLEGKTNNLTGIPTFADYYNNWTYHKVDDLTGYWTAEVVINGLKTTSDAIVNISNDEGIFYKSELSDGAISFYATRAILDYLCQEKISDLQSENQALRLAASQQAQNNYLVSQLGTKAPVPAYVVANPYCNCGTAAYGCGLTA